LTKDSSSTLLQLALIGGLGVGVPVTVILLTAIVAVVVRRRRQRRKRLERSRSAIFINNRHSDNLHSSSSNSSINNAVALRQNRANSALISAVPTADLCLDAKSSKSSCAVDADADSDSTRRGADRVSSRNRGNAGGCSYIKLTNHQPQHQQRHSHDPNIYQHPQQQQYLLHPSHYHSRHHHSLLSQFSPFSHHNRPPPPLQPLSNHNHHHRRHHSNVCRSAYVDDFDLSTCSVVQPLKSSLDGRFGVNVVQPVGSDGGAACGCGAHCVDDDVGVNF